MTTYAVNTDTQSIIPSHDDSPIPGLKVSFFNSNYVVSVFLDYSEKDETWKMRMSEALAALGVADNGYIETIIGYRIFRWN